MARGSYEEIIAELNCLGLDALSSGNERKARRIARAFNAVEAGAQEVRLGDCLYVVSTPQRAPTVQAPLPAGILRAPLPNRCYPGIA